MKTKEKAIPEKLKGLNFGHWKYDEKEKTWLGYMNKEAYQAYLNWNPEPTFERYADFMVDEKNKLALDMRSEERKKAKQNKDEYCTFTGIKIN